MTKRLVFLLVVWASFVFLAGCKCERGGHSLESPQDGLLLRLDIDENYEKLTVTVRNISDRPIWVLDEVTRRSIVWNPYGPTEVYVVDSHGQVLSRLKGMPSWWLQAGFLESQGAAFSLDSTSLAPGGELTGTFWLESELAYLRGHADFDAWKRDKSVKFRVWASYGLVRQEMREMRVESPWIDARKIQRMRPVPPDQKSERSERSH